MDRHDSTNGRGSFTVLVIISFFVVSFFLLFIQYISFNYTDAVFDENNRLIRENIQMALEKRHGDAKFFVDTRVEKGDTILLVTFTDKSNPKQVLSRKILTGKDIRDLNINSRLAWNAGEAQKYSYIVITTILCLGIALCVLIIWQFRKLNSLVIQLDSAEKRAQEALVAKQNFLANMSHEIRTPLNSIIGFTKLIKRRRVSSDISEFVSVIENAGDNLLRIVNDVLDLSKIEAGMLSIVKRPFRLGELMRSTQELFGARISEKGLRLSITIDPEVPDVLLGDETRLTQILINLIENAIKFSQRGEISISALAENRSNSNVLLVFKVRDEGVGIDPEKISQIFERYTQAEESTSRKYGGTGLGLAIVRDLVLLQNGSIEAHSQLNTGTIISFSIPYGIAQEELTKPQIVNSPTNIDTAGLQLLVVDDNIMNLDLMEQLLKEWKIICTTVSDGKQAIEELKKKHFDMILMDIQMPIMDGYAATKYIRENLKVNTPIVAMTASAMEGEIEKCIQNGMNAYISKPVNETELLELIARFTKIVTSHNDNRASQSINSNFQYIDLTYIKQISNGSIAYEKKVTRQFIDLVPKALQELQTANVDQDFKTVRQIAHNMQTTLAIMGVVPKYGHLLDAIEHANAQHPHLPEIGELTVICNHALSEAQIFYTSIEHENSI